MKAQKVSGMKVRHYALVCSAEETADRFYEKLLGLKKWEPRTVPAALSGPLLGIPSDLTVLNYVGDEVHIEVFVHRVQRPVDRSPAHICLEVEDMDGFLGRCRAMGIPVSRAPRGDRWITFIQDYDGNRFEIKESAP